MPCRALEAFRLMTIGRGKKGLRRIVLMPCRALEAFRRILKKAGVLDPDIMSLNALSGIGGVQTCH